MIAFYVFFIFLSINKQLTAKHFGINDTLWDFITQLMGLMDAFSLVNVQQSKKLI